MREMMTRVLPLHRQARGDDEMHQAGKGRPDTDIATQVVIDGPHAGPNSAQRTDRQRDDHQDQADIGGRDAECVESPCARRRPRNAKNGRANGRGLILEARFRDHPPVRWTHSAVARILNRAE